MFSGPQIEASIRRGSHFAASLEQPVAVDVGPAQEPDQQIEQIGPPKLRLEMPPRRRAGCEARSLHVGVELPGQRAGGGEVHFSGAFHPASASVRSISATTAGTGSVGLPSRSSCWVCWVCVGLPYARSSNTLAACTRSPFESNALASAANASGVYCRAACRMSSVNPLGGPLGLPDCPGFQLVLRLPPLPAIA